MRNEDVHEVTIKNFGFKIQSNKSTQKSKSKPDKRGTFQPVATARKIIMLKRIVGSRTNLYTYMISATKYGTVRNIVEQIRKRPPTIFSTMPRLPKSQIQMMSICF